MNVFLDGRMFPPPRARYILRRGGGACHACTYDNVFRFNHNIPPATAG
jgi:hypothetical protein